jgi:copper(I)-binding protein
VGKQGSASGGAPTLSRRRRTAIAVLFACAPLVAACGAGFEAQTNQVYQPAVGVNDRSGEVFVINALLVTAGTGTGTVVASLINQSTEPDRLVAVVASATNGAPLDSTDLGAGIELPSQESVQVADEGITVTAGADAATPGSEEPSGVTAGALVTLQFQFERAAVVEIEVPVVSNESEHSDVYVDVPVSPAASPQ